ncbi:MAG: hypothetical protein JXB48_12305 [Candidatus Latescibacteria bacterium]|nr:hypothetical protein [Candidatus Latescibacterota bacterium]
MNIFSFEFKRSIYSPTDLFDLGTRLFNTAGEKLRQDPKGEQVANALKAALDTMVTVTERDKTNPVTVKIHGKDAIRDNELLMIRDTIKSKTHDVHDSDVQEAANALFKVYNRHFNDLSKMGSGRETRSVKHFIEEMTESENRVRCDSIDITPLIESLGRTQAELEALYVERTRIAPAPGEYTQQKAMRLLKNAVSGFLGYIDIMTASDEQGIVELKNEVGRILTYVESIARARKIRLHNNETGEPEQPITKAA